MSESNFAVYLHALTPIHCGTGQVSASVIDLPVAREKATNWPIIPASSLKGVLRAAVPDVDPERKIKLFGGPDKEGDLRQGELRIGDARLLCLAARSWRGTFAYVTCPLALNRLRRDLVALGAPAPFDCAAPMVGAHEAALAPDSLLADMKLADRKEVWLDDLKLSVTAQSVDPIAVGIAAAVFSSEEERKTFTQRFTIVSDEVFDFLTETATEVAARIKLNEESKTVDKEKGALWYEEAVPAESIFVAPVRGGRPPVDKLIQIGGHETVGRGFCRVTVAS